MEAAGLLNMYFKFSIIVTLLFIKSSFGFFDGTASNEFLQAYVMEKHFDAVNILLSEESDLNIHDRKKLWGSLDIPFMVVVIDPSKKLEENLLGRNSLSIAFAKTVKNIQLLSMASEKNLLRHFSWLIIGSPKEIGGTRKPPYLALDNQVVFIEELSDSSSLFSNKSQTITLKEAYQASPYLPYIVQPIGQWSQNGGLTIIEGDPANRRRNLSGLHFRCTTLPQAPFVYVSEGSPGEVVQLLQGYIKDIWHSLQETFQFSYTCHTPSDNEWGSYRVERWTGLVKEIKDRTADVIVAPLDFSGQRSTVVQSLIGIRTVGYNMIIKRPGLMSSTWTSFTTEFNSEAWITAIAMMFFAPLCLMLVTKYSPYEEWRVPYHDACVVTLGSLTVQGSWINVSSISSRVVFITIFLGNLLVYAHYTSSLVAQLTITSDIPSYFSSLQDFLQHGGYSLGFKKGIALEDDFRQSKSYPYRDIWEKFIQSGSKPLPLSDEDGLTRVKNEDFVYMMEENLFKFGFSNSCDVMLLSNSYFTSTTSLALPLDSPYTKAFNNHLTRLRMTGALDRFWKRWQPPTSSCTTPPFVALSIEQTCTAFLVLLLGVIVSSFVCLPIEKFYNYWRDERNPKVFDLIPRKPLHPNVKPDGFGYPLQAIDEMDHYNTIYPSIISTNKKFR